jgi:hypothetical protein
VLLVVTYSQEARTALRNVCRNHEESVVRRLGRATLFEATGAGAFLACRLQERYPEDVQVERTRRFNEFADAPDDVREAAVAYERESGKYTPYEKFAAGTDHPTLEELQHREL